MVFKKRFVIIPITAAICCYLPALLLWFLGYVKVTQWNDDLVKTKCTILKHTITEVTCNCKPQYEGPSYCESSSYNCYDGYIYTEYNVKDMEYNKTFKIYDNDDSKNDVEKSLNEKYPIGHKIDCYYPENDPINIRINKKETNNLLAIFIIFLVMGTAILLVWPLCELCNHKILKASTKENSVNQRNKL